MATKMKGVGGSTHEGGGVATNMNGDLREVA